MKLKDYVTLGNLLGGFAAVIALFAGSFDWACYFIYIAYVFDVLDGPVARLTKQYDTFGGVFDEVCDYITNSVMASFVVFYAFWKNAGYPMALAAVIAAFPLTLGSLRQARSMDKPLSYPCYWLGLPRPVLALFVLSVLNSSWFNIKSEPLNVIAPASVAVAIIVGSFFHLSKIPFPNHQKRRFMGPMWFGRLWFLGGSPILFAVCIALGHTRWVYDYLTFSFVMYVFVSWTQIPPQDKRRIRHYIATGELENPLVHKDNTWRPSGWVPALSKE
ncbi:MAG: CDP-alcohol phosphatidyltransferase family protein [Deltaproteobacteria bacterium]|nr:CDP-alcohol phosphatidyltransferase family protein [Deltaproteobacteria bacterium]